MVGFNDLSEWVIREGTSAVNHDVFKQLVPAVLCMFCIQVSLVIAESLFPSPLALVLLGLAGVALVAGVYFVLGIIAAMPSMGRFFLMGISKIIGVPIYAAGFGRERFLLDADLREMPRAEAGAFVERFAVEPGRTVKSQSPAIANRVIPMRHRRRDLPAEGWAFLKSLADLLKRAYQFQQSKAHSAPYQDQRVLDKISAWV